MERINDINTQVNKNDASKKESLTITDKKGNSFELKIHKNEYVLANDLLKVGLKEEGVLRSYDPGYMNTISCTSKISYIDGDKGILEYRGIPIEQLAEKSNFLEVAFLLIYGELPTPSQFQLWKQKIQTHTLVHQDINQMMKSFRYDAHPMGMLVSTIAATSTFHPEANPALSGQDIYNDSVVRNKQIHRIIGNITTISANCYRHRIGRSHNKPHPKLDYVENFLFMLDRLNENKYLPHPKLVKALDILFILHAEHELNCSTAAVRHLCSSGVDVYSCISGAAAALYGPKHGGANEAVLRMLNQIGKKENIPQFIQDVKDRKKLLFGFGHRVYKSYDPRATIIKKVADEVFEIVGKEPLVEIAIELERIALSDEYFVKRKLYPNVDFYSGVIYKAMGFPTDMFPVLFTIPRVAGWLAHWNEFVTDQENKIVRPRQNYQGLANKDYVDISQRPEKQSYLDAYKSASSRRRQVSNEFTAQRKEAKHNATQA